MYRIPVMKTSAAPAVLFLLLLELHFVSFTTGAITCTAGAFADRAPNGAITCDFNQDVNSTQHNFNVVHYPFRHTDSVISDSGNYILLCNWGQNRQLECKVDDGYSFNYNVTSTLRVRVKSMSKRVEGMYVCQLVPDQGIPVTTCNLTVLELSTDVPAQTTDSSSTSQVESKSRVDLPVIILAVIVVLQALVLILIVVCCRRTILRKFQRRFGQTGENNPEEPRHRDVDIPLMDIGRDVKYPKNARHKPTQVYIDVIDKSIQAGNELGVRFSEKFTQLHLDAERTLLTGNLKASKGDKELAGSSERFSNPVYSTIAPPMKFSPKYENTEVAKNNSQLCANVGVELEKK